MNFLDKYKVNNGNPVDGKYYKVYDEQKSFLYNIPVTQEKNLTNQFLKGVTCFVVNEQGQILLEKRTNTELTPGKIDLVSGHVDMEEIEKQSIIRELGEEVGIQENEAVNAEKICTMSLGFENKGKIRNFFITFYYVFIKNSNLKIQEQEVKSLHWVPMEQAFKMLESGKTKFPKASENIKYNEIFDTVRNAYKNVYLKRNSNKVKRDIVE